MKHQLLIKRILQRALADTVSVEGHLSRHDRLYQTTLGLGQTGLDELRQSLSSLRHILMNDTRQTITQIPSETPTETLFIQWIEGSLATFRSGFADIQQHVFALKAPEQSLELRQFLSQSLWTRLCVGLPGLAVLPTVTSTTPTLALEKTSLLGLSAARLNQPNRWLSLTHSITHFITHSSSQAISTIEAAPRFAPLLNAVLALRLAGPAYYIERVMCDLEQGDFETLFAVEPLLFEALSHFGVTHKDALILHQSIESLRSGHADGIAGSPFDDSHKRRAYELTETLVPERFAFTEKQLTQTATLVDRCREGVLISAMPQTALPEVLKASLTELTDEDSIRPLLDQFSETPASPFQILSAGTLHETENAPIWVSAVLTDDAPWSSLYQHTEQLNALLLRSFSIAQIHNLLDSQQSHSLV